MERKHQYRSVEAILRTIEEKLKDEGKIFTIFENCYTNTLDKAVKQMPDKTVYVVTGDIPAMWLRDSVAQLRPYLTAAKDEPEITALLVGLSKRQFQYINIDPYANEIGRAHV